MHRKYEITLNIVIVIYYFSAVFFSFQVQANVKDIILVTMVKSVYTVTWLYEQNITFIYLHIFPYIFKKKEISKSECMWISISC